MTRTRRTLAALVLVFLAVTGGCAALTGNRVDQDKLDEDVDYGPYWDADANATIVVGPDRYKVLYRIHNRSSLEVYRFERLNNRRAIDPIGVQFRYPNGTIVGANATWVDKTGSGTVISLPADNGTLALSAPKRGKRVRVPTVVEGSYEVILPPNARVNIPLMGRVIPRDYTHTVEAGRVHLTWNQVSGDRIVVRYYLVRDLYLFGGLLAVGIVLAIVGLAYLWRQLRSIRRQREEVGIDVESGGDDSGPGPF